jgi:hypothetical protein
MGSTAEEAARLRAALLYEDGIEIQLHAWRGRLGVRVSGQVYNDLEDVEPREEISRARDRRRPGRVLAAFGGVCLMRGTTESGTSSGPTARA